MQHLYHLMASANHIVLSAAVLAAYLRNNREPTNAEITKEIEIFAGLVTEAVYETEVGVRMRETYREMFAKFPAGSERFFEEAAKVLFEMQPAQELHPHDPRGGWGKKS